MYSDPVACSRLLSPATQCVSVCLLFALSQIDMKFFVGFVGVLLVLFAVLSSIGLLSYIGVAGSLIILEVVPFLVLAVGVDNLFIIVHSYEVSTRCLCKIAPSGHLPCTVCKLLGAHSTFMVWSSCYLAC